jgi:hypothetical protein
MINFSIHKLTLLCVFEGWSTSVAWKQALFQLAICTWGGTLSVWRLSSKLKGTVHLNNRAVTTRVNPQMLMLKQGGWAQVHRTWTIIRKYTGTGRATFSCVCELRARTSFGSCKMCLSTNSELLLNPKIHSQYVLASSKIEKNGWAPDKKLSKLKLFLDLLVVHGSSDERPLCMNLDEAEQPNRATEGVFSSRAVKFSGYCSTCVTIAISVQSWTN